MASRSTLDLNSSFCPTSKLFKIGPKEAKKARSSAARSGVCLLNKINNSFSNGEFSGFVLGALFFSFPAKVFVMMLNQYHRHSGHPVECLKKRAALIYQNLEYSLKIPYYPMYYLYSLRAREGKWSVWFHSVIHQLHSPLLELGSLIRHNRCTFCILVQHFQKAFFSLRSLF